VAKFVDGATGSYLVNTHPANDLLPDQVTWWTRS